LATSPLSFTTSNFFFQLSTCGHNPYIIFSMTRGYVCRLQLILASAVIPRSESPWDSWPHFTVSDSRFLQPGGPGPRIFIPQEQGVPVISQALGPLFVPCYDSQGYGENILE
jgi:hypothetical protein